MPNYSLFIYVCNRYGEFFHIFNKTKHIFLDYTCSAASALFFSQCEAKFLATNLSKFAVFNVSPPTPVQFLPPLPMVLLPKATKNLYKVQYKGKLSILILHGLAAALALAPP